MFNPQTQGAVAGLASDPARRGRGGRGSRRGAATTPLQSGGIILEAERPFLSSDGGMTRAELTGQPHSRLLPRAWAETSDDYQQFTGAASPGGGAVRHLERVNRQGRRAGSSDYFPVNNRAGDPW